MAPVFKERQHPIANFKLETKWQMAVFNVHWTTNMQILVTPAPQNKTKPNKNKTKPWW